MTNTVAYQSFVFLHGLVLPRAVMLTDSLQLRPASGVASPEVAFAHSNCTEDASVLLLLLPRVTAELRVMADSEENRGRAVWNAGWEALLLAAVCACRVAYAVESSSSATAITAETRLRVMHYHLHGWQYEPRSISEEDCTWLENNFHNARSQLFDSDSFRNAVHCASSYWWHPHPRPQLALLWAGIESLFVIDSELSFRLSLLASKFLEPDDVGATRSLFRDIRNLYKARSKAVHGAEFRGDATSLISDSAALLHRLIRRCIEVRSLPNTDALVP